jgi:hypothetical protein
MKIPKENVAQCDFFYQKDSKVSEIAAREKADIAINFPFFWAGNVLGDNKDHDKVISAAYNEQLPRHEWGWNGERFVIGQLENATGYDFIAQGAPLLINEGHFVWDWYRQQENVPDDIGKSRAQRTFVGVDADGNLLLAVADGRTVWDQGLTLEEMALYMAAQGAVTALNGDGGSSSVLYVNGAVQNQNAGTAEPITHHAVCIYLKHPVANDVPEGHWAEAAIRYAVENKIMSNDDNGNFNPDAPVTRAMLAQVLKNVVRMI